MFKALFSGTPILHDLTMVSEWYSNNLFSGHFGFLSYHGAGIKTSLFISNTHSILELTSLF